MNEISQKIEIKCQGAISLPLADLVDFQGNLKKVPNFDNVFVSDSGTVFQKNDHPNAKHPKTLYVDKDGYCRVWIKNNQHKRGVQFVPVHRLIAMAFHGVPHVGMVSNHKNGIRMDNRPENLEWVTPTENERHARRVLGKRLLGEKCSRSKLSSCQVIDIRLMRKCFGSSVRELCARFDVSRAQIQRILERKNWGHVQE